MTIPQHVGNYGQPAWQDPSWDPLWQACVDESTIVNIHIGTGGGVPVPSDLTSYLAYNAIVAIDAVRFTADLLFSRVVTEFTDLKIALSEGGIGWIPFVLERFEDTYSRQRAWTGDDLGDGLSPTDVFRRNFVACFIRDRRGIEMRDQIGIDNICWEMDYPHSDSMWPGAPEELGAVFDTYDVPDDEINKMTFENAMRWYHWDPFTHIPKDQATVGALRKAAEGHDVSIQALSKHEHGGANFADFAANAKELTGNKD